MARGITLDPQGQVPLSAHNVERLYEGATLYDPSRGEQLIVVALDVHHSIVTVQTLSGRRMVYNYAIGIYTHTEEGFYSWLGRQAPPQERHFRWPEALYNSKIEGASRRPMGCYDHFYDETSGIARYDASSKRAQAEAPRWIDEDRRDDYRLTVRGGLLYDAQGQVIANGTVQFAFSADWILFGQAGVSKEDTHARYLRGGDVRSAGWILTDAQGRITRVGGDSGHYGPSLFMLFMLFQLLAYLRNYGVDLAGLTLHDAADSLDYDALAIWQWLAEGGGRGKPRGKAGKSL